MSDHLDAQIRAGIGNSREFFQQESHRALDALLSELDAAEARLAACEDDAPQLDEADHADVEHREGVCEVYDWTGAYRGCIGVEEWERLLGGAR